MWISNFNFGGSISVAFTATNTHQDVEELQRAPHASSSELSELSELTVPSEPSEPPAATSEWLTEDGTEKRRKITLRASKQPYQLS